MDLATLQPLVQAFLDLFIEGVSEKTRLIFPDSVHGGIRHRIPARVGIPPEYEPIPLGLDNVEFEAGEGPEASDVPYLFRDACPLQRAVVTPTEEGLDVEFIFKGRFGANEFAEGITQTICLTTNSDDLASIASECLNQVRDYLGTDASLVGTEDNPFFPPFSSTITLLES